MDRLAPLVAVLALAGLLAGCGGGSSGGAGGPTGSGSPLAACTSGLPADGAVDVPAGFPKPAGAIYTSSKQAGPSTIIEGYYDGDISQAFDAYKAALSTGAFSVTKDEREARDAEVFFGGSASNGQVDMFLECTGRTKLRITVRPL